MGCSYRITGHGFTAESAKDAEIVELARREAEDAVVVGRGASPAIAIARGNVQGAVGALYHVTQSTVLVLVEPLVGEHPAGIG